MITHARRIDSHPQAAYSLPRAANEIFLVRRSYRNRLGRSVLFILFAILLPLHPLSLKMSLTRVTQQPNYLSTISDRSKLGRAL